MTVPTTLPIAVFGHKPTYIRLKPVGSTATILNEMFAESPFSHEGKANKIVLSCFKIIVQDELSTRPSDYCRYFAS